MIEQQANKRTPLDDYEIGEYVGAGTFGVVYEATNKHGRQVAIKQVKPKGPVGISDPDRVKRQGEREEKLAPLFNKNCLSLTFLETIRETRDFNKKESATCKPLTFYFVTEFCQNGDLDDKMKEIETGFPVEIARLYALQLATVLADFRRH